MLPLLAYTAGKVGQVLPARRWMGLPLAALLFFLMLGPLFLYRSRPRVFGKGWFRALAWSGSLVMGLWATWVLLSLPFDFLHLLAVLFEVLVGGAVSQRGWSTDIFHDLALALPCLAGGMAVLGLLEALRGPRVRRVHVPIEGLAPDLQGLRIVQLSDLHVGPTLRRSFVEKVVRRANRENADLILITGDLADAFACSIREELEPFRGLGSRYGTYYVTGNHEYYLGDADGILATARELGFVPLLNENRSIPVGGAKLLVSGITDPAGEAPDLKKASRSEEKAALRILLAHQPDAWPEAERLGFDLQFSGHTHSGQFVPFSLLIGLFHRYKRGLYRVGRMWLYVSPGTGFWGPPNRLGVAAEVTSVTLGAPAAVRSL